MHKIVIDVGERGQSEEGFGIAGVSNPMAYNIETGCQEIPSSSSFLGMAKTPGGCNNPFLF